MSDRTSIVLLADGDLDEIKGCAAAIEEYAPAGSYELVVADPEPDGVFTVTEIDSLFAEAGCGPLRETAPTVPVTDEDRALRHALETLATTDTSGQFRVSQYLVKVAKQRRQPRTFGLGCSGQPVVDRGGAAGVLRAHDLLDHADPALELVSPLDQLQSKLLHLGQEITDDIRVGEIAEDHVGMEPEQAFGLIHRHLGRRGDRSRGVGGQRPSTSDPSGGEDVRQIVDPRRQHVLGERSFPPREDLHVE
jgi:hypothetical protein